MVEHRRELKIPQSVERRCARTGNPCGTDTWAIGRDCGCEECQRWLKEGGMHNEARAVRRRGRAITVQPYIVNPIPTQEMIDDVRPLVEFAEAHMREWLNRLDSDSQSTNNEGLV